MKRAARWPGASIHTTQNLQRTNRQLSRKSAGASRVISAMKDGACLLCSNERGRVLWRLSSGPFITQEIADIVIQNPHVIGVNDGLLPDHHQTWRYCNND